MAIGKAKKGLKGLMDLLDEPVIDPSLVNRKYSNRTAAVLEDFYRPNIANDVRTFDQAPFKLSQLEGRGVMFPESDVTASGYDLVGIGNKPLARPVTMETGVDHIFYAPDKALWKNDASVANKYVKRAKARQAEVEKLGKDTGGQDVFLLPYEGGPQSSDWWTGIGRTMINYNLENAPAKSVSLMDEFIKSKIPDWPGADSPNAEKIWNATGGGTRMEVTAALDKMRLEGGLTEGQARVATSRQDRLNIPHGSLQNVGVLDIDRGFTPNLSPDYNASLHGEGVGVLQEPVTAYDFLLDRTTASGKPLAPRSLQWQDTSKIVTEQDLRRMQDKGININSPASVGVLGAAAAAAALAPDEVEAGPAGLLRNVMPAPQRMFDPANKDYKPFLSSFGETPGGRYLEMGPDGPVDITGQSPASANISVGPDGKPKFQVAGEERKGTPPNKGRKVKTNLFKKKAGWKWSQVPEGYDPEPAGDFPIVSVQDGKKHYYTVDAQFPDGVDLTTYPNSASEPRLRPTRKGSVELGDQIGEIDVRGKKHPVYSRAVIRQAAPVAMTGILGAGMSDESDASLAKLAARGLELTDMIDPKDSRVGEYFLSEPDSTKSIGVLRTDSAVDSGFDDGYMASQLTEIDPEYRRQGLAGEMYAAAEELSGNKLVPSTTLSPDGAAMWNSRDRGLLEQVQQKMGSDNYSTVEDVLNPDGMGPSVQLKGFDRKYAAPAAGLLAASEYAEPREYREAPVVEEQSFGDMIQEYADMNQRTEAAEDQKFDALMREDTRLREMGSASFGKLSPELAAYRRSQILPFVGELGMGALGGAVDSLDFLSQIPSSIASMRMPERTPLRDRLGGLLDYSFMDERNQKAIDEARFIGGLLSPI